MTFDEAKNKVGSQRAELLQRLERADAPSAGAASENHASRERSSLATCSLPVSIVAASALSLRVLARSAVDARDARNALRLAGVLSGEADAVCATERQPEENKEV